MTPEPRVTALYRFDCTLLKATGKPIPFSLDSSSYNYIIIITCDLHPFLQSFLLYECVSSPKVSYSVP